MAKYIAVDIHNVVKLLNHFTSMKYTDVKSQWLSLGRAEWGRDRDEDLPVYTKIIF